MPILWQTVPSPMPFGWDEKLLAVVAARWPKRFTEGKKFTVNLYNILYFRGLADAGMASAQQLVQLYDQHGDIDIWPFSASDP